MPTDSERELRMTLPYARSESSRRPLPSKAFWMSLAGPATVLTGFFALIFSFGSDSSPAILVLFPFLVVPASATGLIASIIEVKRDVSHRSCSLFVLNLIAATVIALGLLGLVYASIRR